MGQELRRYHRVGVALEMRVRGTDRSGVAFEETTASDDVSRGGCSFHSAHEIEMGKEVELEIYRRTAPRRAPTPFLTTGVVVRATQLEPDQYQVSVQFTGPQFPAYASETTTS
jgi:hypothetical protein